MAVIKVDLSNVDSNSLLPEGEYQAVVYDVAQKQNKAQDGFNLHWQFKVVGGEHEGKSLFLITSLKENALFRLRDVLVALGVPIPESGQLEFDTEDLLAKPCTVVVTQGEYNGKKRNEVKEVLPPKEGVGDPFVNNGDDDEY